MDNQDGTYDVVRLWPFASGGGGDVDPADKKRDGGMGSGGAADRKRQRQACLGAFFAKM